MSSEVELFLANRGVGSEVELFLAHHGVKGMKWGRRKGGGVEVAKSAKAVAKQEHKTKVQSARNDMYNNMKGAFNAHKGRNATALIGSAVLMSPAGAQIVSGTMMMRGAGFSKGKSFATGLLGGPLGAVAMIELQARKTARSS